MQGTPKKDFSGGCIQTGNPAGIRLDPSPRGRKHRELQMTLKTLLAATAAFTVSAVTAQAAQVAALIGNDTIAIVDTGAKKVTKTMKVEGIKGELVGIDCARPTACSTRLRPTARFTPSAWTAKPP
jgi:hypothetical protein